MEIEMEICANCKKEIPQSNYVMHTIHCARNINLCPKCKEPFPRSEIEAHKQSCGQETKKREEPFKKAPSPPTRYEKTKLKERKSSFESYKSSTNGYKENGMSSSSSSLNQKSSKSNVSFADDSYKSVKSEVYRGESYQSGATSKPKSSSSSSSSSMLACKYCDLELPKLDLDDHENYCGSRTDKCMECGEIVMFKYKKLHEDSNHGFIKLNDEPGPKASWDSNTQRTASASDDSYSSRNRLPSYRPFTTFDIAQYATFSPASMGFNNGVKEEKKESYKDISRRLDCKTEYIRNLLHDSASITIPLRTTGTGVRNHFNHNKGPAPQPPSRRRNPPTELVIPCEFCELPVPHLELVAHEAICRRPRRRRASPEEDDYTMPFVPPPPTQQFTSTGVPLTSPSAPYNASSTAYNSSSGASYNPSSSSSASYLNTPYHPDDISDVPYSPSNTNVDDEDLPCEFCSDMIPASQLWRHQMTCNS